MAFAVVFIGAGVTHIVQGRVAPDSYAVFGDKALWAGFRDWWSSFIIAHIGWLTLALAAFQTAARVFLLLSGRRVTIAVVAILAFLTFLLVLGYGFPATGIVEDLLKNRVFTVVMAALLIPVLAQPDHPPILAAWRKPLLLRTR